MAQNTYQQTIVKRFRNKKNAHLKCFFSITKCESYIKGNFFQSRTTER